MEDFCVELAGVAIQIRCTYPENRRFLSGCLTQRALVFTGRILRLEQRILEQVPFFRLHCNMEPEAAQTAYAGMILNSPSVNS